MRKGIKHRLIVTLGKLYVPATSLLLVFLVGNWLAASTAIDPLTVAQNPRIRFQKGEDLGGGSGSGLSDAEARLAKAVLGDKGSAAPDKPPQLLYMGNSQVLGIMDRKKGDMLSAQWLQVLLARQSDHGHPLLDVRLESLPNLSMTEFLMKLIAATQYSRGQVSVVLGSLVLEEFRFLRVRDEVQALLEKVGARNTLMKLLAGNSDLQFGVHAVEAGLGVGASDDERAPGASKARVVMRISQVEDLLQLAVNRIPLFARRSDLYAGTTLAYYHFRNRLLHVTSATARPVPEPSFQANLEILELSLRYAQSQGLRVILYLGPIRPIQPNRNTPEDIARFRKDIPMLCHRYNVTCLDYTDLIPSRLWTNYPDWDVAAGGQPDFAHFTGAAHKLLAEQLMTDVGPLLTNWVQVGGSPQR